MSIYLEFLGPQKVAGRRVLFIEGENDGKMMVRNGGKHFDYVTVNIAPDSDSAREESLVPITQSGFNRMLAQMIDVSGTTPQGRPQRHEHPGEADRGGKNQQATGQRDSHRASAEAAGARIPRGQRLCRRRAARAGACRLLAVAQPGQPETAAGGRVHLYRVASSTRTCPTARSARRGSRAPASLGRRDAGLRRICAGTSRPTSADTPAPGFA